LSYVVSIWEQPPALPLPGDIHGAGRLMDMLHRVRPGPNPRFVELIRQLTARYPDITSPEAEDADPDQLAWIDGPLSGETDACVYNLGLGTGMLREVRPFVIATARALGLNVYDAQAAEAHFADGTFVSKSYSRATGFERRVAQRLAPFMARHGYAPRDDGESFRSVSEAGWTQVSVEVAATWPPHYQVLFASRHENWSISDLSTEINSESGWKRPPPGTARPSDTGPLGIVGQGRWIDRAAPFVDAEGAFRLRSENELDAALPVIVAQLEERLLPLLARAQTIEGYDALMNPPVLTDSPFFISKVFHGWERGYRNVLAAHLAGNPRVLEICDAVDAGLEGEPAWSTVFYSTRKIVEHVRREHGLAWGRKE
jgi:hypothetical protein